MRLPNNYYHPRCYWAQMVTLRCNAGCGFCILNTRGRCDSPEECTADELLDFWNSIDHPKGQRLSLIGGEPTLYPDIVKLINGLKGYAITLTTNCKSPFYNDESFPDQIRVHETSTLRINTSFHPHFIDADTYYHVVCRWKDAGYQLDQISYVDYPDVNQFDSNLKRAKRLLPLVNAPYMGFYDRTNHFHAPFTPGTNQPSSSHFNREKAAKTIGFKSLKDYNDMTGQYEKREVECFHPFLSLMISPDGYYYRCHYHLYHAIDPICHISDFQTVTKKHMNCRHYGFCEGCDVARLGGQALPDPKPLTLNKLVDESEKARPEIRSFLSRVRTWCAKNHTQYYDSYWFELAYAILYSGHRHRGKTLWIARSDNQMVPQYLKSEGYKVTTAFGFNDVIQSDDVYDLILNFDVFPFFDSAYLRMLCERLIDGGIMVLSTQFFYDDDCRWQPNHFLYLIGDSLNGMEIETVGKTDYGTVPTEKRGILILRKPVKPLPNPEAKSDKPVVHKWR